MNKMANRHGTKRNVPLFISSPSLRMVHPASLISPLPNWRFTAAEQPVT
jgi:hypothetical protein